MEVVTLGDFVHATAGLSESVKLRYRGELIVVVAQNRDANGDLYVDLDTAAETTEAPVVPAVPSQADAYEATGSGSSAPPDIDETDRLDEIAADSDLTPAEQDALAETERLGGVAPGDGGAPDIGRPIADELSDDTF